MAEEAVSYVIEKLLRPIGIDLSPKVFYEASLNNDEYVNEMKTSLYTFLAHLFIANRQDAKNWIRKCTIPQAEEVLRLYGFDPFLFDLENSSQHLLVTICWLIWRSDLFQKLYDPLIPQNDVYLPPYGIFCNDGEEIQQKPLRSPPSNPDELTLGIQRLIGKISYQLQVLSDLEMTRETLHWKIRSIDPDTSLYALSLKAKPSILNAHTEALRKAIQNSDKIKEIARIEQLFWRWAFSVVDNLIVESDRFDETRSIPIDWYPPFTTSPYTRHNKGVDDLQFAMNEMKQKLQKCRVKFGNKKINEKQSGLNGRQIDLIKREIDDLMEKLERTEEVKEEVQEEKSINLIPELPFKEFSDTKLQRIIAKSQQKSADIAKKACPEIASIVNEICTELNLQPHGWKCDNSPKVKE
ncbi:hypothetical protein GPJ56_009258 [Histomonas meleagridis]|uniref:uncharacterized protein n=1 Tax=Histomonas meleagridis TaxID=135588 RepID=UPI003559D397|nr:hypothetical protein GPJ56_009258 [Histomonas meleagridis]KAH0801629.1 hypothetical protein GO595_005628 [Histomonas meleagridis]